MTPPDASRINIPRLRLGIAALRSGLYSQCKGRLHQISEHGDNEGWCCLGVLTDVAVKLGGIQLARVTIPDRNYPGYLQEEFGMEHSFLPPQVMQFYGLPYGNPLLLVPGPDGHVPVSATMLNDTYDALFDQIADAFEYTYITLPAETK